MSILGHRVARKEDPRFLTTGGTYLTDLGLDGAAHVTYVRAQAAHARILAIAADTARQAPGVLGVFLAADLDGLDDIAPDYAGLGVNPTMTRPWLARDVTRYVGEPVAAIVTETRAQGEDALDLVEVTAEPLPTVIDPHAAARDAVLLFPEAGTNIAYEVGEPPPEGFFDECEVVVRQAMVNQRVAPAPLEVRAAGAAWGEDGRLTMWAPTQTPHMVKDLLALYYELAPEHVRVITPDVGGGFGAKIGGYADELLLPWLARRLGRAVQFLETRSESMVAMCHGRGQRQLVEIGGSRDGTVLAYRLHVVQDCGAYPRLGAVLPSLTAMMAPGVYDIANVAASGVAVVTNTTPTGAYRGAGRPEATAAIERAMDLFAAEIGMDPADVRRRNLIAADAFPFDTVTGASYDSGDYEGALDMVLAAAGYQALRAEQARRRAAGEPRAMGVGISTYVEITAPFADEEYGSVGITADGGAIVRVGTSPQGQGHETSFAMVASDQLGIGIAEIEVVHSDTDEVPTGNGTMGSRSLQTGGVAVHRAAAQVVAKGKVVAARLLEADPLDIVLDREHGTFHVTGTPAVSRSWADLAACGDGELSAEGLVAPEGSTFPFGAHLVVVEVDTETGKVEVARVVAVDDCGHVVNPMAVEGQIHGGLGQGLAQALMEAVHYDDEGNPITANLADYAFVSAAELPSFELHRMETPSPLNPLGVKGVGESGTIGSTPALQNAVVDALSHLGVRHIDLPLTPQRVWEAASASTSTEPSEPSQVETPRSSRQP